MKRSEIGKAIASWNGSGEAVAPLMDLVDKVVAHGYEPEEPEIAPVLVAVGTSLMTPIEDANKPGGRRRATHRETALAAEAYNRREEIAAVAHGCRYRADRGQGANPYDLLRWANLLDGKAHGADTQDGEGRS